MRPTTVSVRPRPHWQRLTEFDVRLSVGSTGDAYDNAVAESIIGLFET